MEKNMEHQMDTGLQRLCRNSRNLGTILGVLLFWGPLIYGNYHLMFFGSFGVVLVFGFRVSEV